MEEFYRHSGVISDDEKARLFEMFCAGRTTKEMADMLKCNASMLQNRFKAWGWSRRSLYHKWTPERIEKIKRFRLEGRSWPWIGEYYATDGNTVRKAFSAALHNERIRTPVKPPVTVSDTPEYTKALALAVSGAWR